MKSFIYRFFYYIGKFFKPIITFIFPEKIWKNIKSTVFEKGTGDATRTIEVNPNLPFGANLFGYFSSQLGLGQGVRLVASALEQINLPYCAINILTGVSTVREGITDFQYKYVKKPQYDFNIFHIMPDEAFPVMLMNHPNVLKGRYNIGFWMFELEEIPPNWIENFKYVNEIWTPSTYATTAFKKYAPDIPVLTMPYGISPEVDENLTRVDFGLPENSFLILCMFDSGSTIERKNPLDAIRAFSKAFTDQDDVTLVIKISNPKTEDIEHIEEILKNHKNCIFINQFFSTPEMNRLISLCDVLLSLHRSEGFGLPVAEAMRLGTVVVSTDYSATTDFVAPNRGCPIPYRLVDVAECGIQHHLYTPGNYWAEPDIDAAARALSKLYDDRNYYYDLKENAIEFMEKEYSLQSSGTRIKKRLEDVSKTF